MFTTRYTVDIKSSGTRWGLAKITFPGRRPNMLKSLKAGMLIAASAIFCAAPPLSAQASQIVVSCTTPGPNSKTPNGCRSSELVTTPPIIVNTTLYFVGGFWVWCQNPTTGTPYGPDCNGAMYIAEVNLTTQASVYETKSISGNSSGGGANPLQITVKTSDGDMTCTLTVPTSPTSGPTNTVTGSCDGVPIAFSNAVVQVTK
jgi:hypothetical protein